MQGQSIKYIAVGTFQEMYVFVKANTLIMREDDLVDYVANNTTFSLKPYESHPQAQDLLLKY